MTALDDTLDDLAGLAWLPGIGQILDGIRTAQRAAHDGRLTLDATQTLAVLLGNPSGPDLIEALAHLAQDLTHPDTNPTLTALDPDTCKAVQLLGEQHARDTADYAIRDHTNEAAALITEAAPHAREEVPAVLRLNDDERKKLSEKNAAKNKRSSKPYPK